MKSRSTSSARASSTGERVRLANAVTRISAPSSSRIEFAIRDAMNSSTSAGANSRSWAAFFCRIAIRVSRSGGWMSASRPHSNRVRSRSSSVASCLRRPVGTDHDLLVRVVQRIERVEELLLGPFAVLQELDVVDQQDVDVAVPALERAGLVVAQRVDEVVGELLGRHVPHVPRVAELRGVVTDRVQQVGLAEPGAAVDEQRVVRLRRRLGDRDRGGVREPVGRPDDERLERVLRVEPVAARVARGRRSSRPVPRPRPGPMPPPIPGPMPPALRPVPSPPGRWPGGSVPGRSRGRGAPGAPPRGRGAGVGVVSGDVAVCPADARTRGRLVASVRSGRGVGPAGRLGSVGDGVHRGAGAVGIAAARRRHRRWPVLRRAARSPRPGSAGRAGETAPR